MLKKLLLILFIILLSLPFNAYSLPVELIPDNFSLIASSELASASFQNNTIHLHVDNTSTFPGPEGQAVGEAIDLNGAVFAEDEDFTIKVDWANFTKTGTSAGYFAARVLWLGAGASIIRGHASSGSPLNHHYVSWIGDGTIDVETAVLATDFSGIIVIEKVGNELTFYAEGNPDARWIYQDVAFGGDLHFQIVEHAQGEGAVVDVDITGLDIERTGYPVEPPPPVPPEGFLFRSVWYNCKYYGENLDSSLSANSMVTLAKVSDPEVPIYVDGIPDTQDSVLLELELSGGVRLVSFGDIANLQNWEDRTYEFWFLDKEGTKISTTFFVPLSEPFFREIPPITNIVISGEPLHPTISWDPIDHADFYKIRLYYLDETGRVDRLLSSIEEINNSQNVYNPTTNKWSLTYAGTFFENNPNLKIAISIDAYEMNSDGSSFKNRSINYYGYKAFDTQYATITVDGDPSDWADLNPSFIDFTGDGLCGNDYDIERVYTAIDANYAYLMVETNGAPINIESVLELDFDFKEGSHHWPGLLDDIHTNISYTRFWASDDIHLDGTLEEYPIEGDEFVWGNVMELKIPLSEIENASYFEATKAHIWNVSDPQNQILCDAAFLAMGSIMNVHKSDDSFATYYWINLHNFEGIFPDDIDTITITTPSGQDLPYGKNDFEFYPQWNMIVLDAPGSPSELGGYKFKVGMNGAVATSKDSQDILKTIPVIDKSTLIPADGSFITSVTPTFNWGEVEFPDTLIYYKLTVMDSNDNYVFESGRVKDMLSFTLPEGILTFGNTYKWYIRAVDANNFHDVQNRSNSDRLTYTVVESLPAPIANAGPDRIEINNVTFDGSASSDPDGTIILYHWSLIHRENAALNREADGVNPTIADIEPGFYDVILTVTDNSGLTGTDSMVLAITDAMPEEYYELQEQIIQKDIIINDLNGQIIQQDGVIADLNAQIIQCTEMVDNLNGQIIAQDNVITDLNAQNVQNNIVIDDLNAQIIEKDQVISSQATTIDSLTATLLKKSNSDANTANALKDFVQDAIDQAKALVGETKLILKAENEMILAQDVLDRTNDDGTLEPNYKKAIDHFEQAWKYAQNSLKK